VDISDSNLQKIGCIINPEHFNNVLDKENVVKLLHTIDLLSTILTDFQVNSALALSLFSKDTPDDPLFRDFWQIDIEDYFAFNFLDLCYQLFNTWKELDNFGKKDSELIILNRAPNKTKTTELARHVRTHACPEDFQRHKLSQKYAILRCNYFVENNVIKKELAKNNMPKVAKLINNCIIDSFSYLQEFDNAINYRIVYP
jgi:hypothetical protein